MAIPAWEPWRETLQPASFNGAGFFVAIDAKGGGRRNVVHEFPKLDTPYAEDMGRRARKFTISGYVIQNSSNGYNYQPGRDALIAALETEGPGVLVHPTLGTDAVQPDVYSVTERLEDRGGMAEFEMTFVEAGSPPGSTTNTANASTTAAQSAIASFQNSSDIASAQAALIAGGGTP
jgi:prophage DNA circulation protein